MVETITPVVHGGRGRWLRALALHVLGATAAAALFGAILAEVGRLLGAPWGRAGLLALALAAGLYALSELHVVTIPVPQLRRQVPDWWRTFFGRDVAAALYGAGLGVGFLTYLADGTLVAVAFAAVASGNPAVGALIVAPFGLLRGLASALAYGSDTPEASRALVDRLVAAPKGRRHAANEAALAVVALSAAATAARLAPGGWWGLAGAALAATFGWAAATKILGRRRWRRVLRVHELPAGLERAAGPLVPTAEALVPLLVMAGLPRPAAALAIVLLAGFSLELLRVRLRVGGRVPCGCFGGRDRVDVRVMLLRNLGLGALAVSVLLGARDAPRFLPIATSARADLLPLSLVLGSLSAAVLAAWRANTWLARGRGA
jgi:hypothetical protein